MLTANELDYVVSSAINNAWTNKFIQACGME